MDRYLFYLRHPIQTAKWLLSRLAAWRVTRKARKAAREYMRNLREMEANLREAADPCCSKCYGQGQRGFNLKTKQWVICTCTHNPRTAEKCEEKPWLRS
jgi:hypothetical protein